ncbi:MAG TPA: RNA-binding cell elongation regulator Jag/EloR [Candidatus Binataceae bacterium]
MSDTDSIEVTAPTIDEAIKQALDQMGAAEDDVAIEILSSPRSGVLGLGARPAKVRVKRRLSSAASSAAGSPSSPAYESDPAAPSGEPGGLAAAARTAAAVAASAPSPAPTRLEGRTGAGPDLNPIDDRDDERGNRTSAEHLDRSDAAADRKSAAVGDQAHDAIQTLTAVLAKMSEKAEVRLAASDEEGIELEVKGDGSGILIGRHGQTLDALEYLINRILARRIRDPVPVTIDTEAYRARRNQQLERMALSMGERAKREHQKMTLEPMPPRDRRIIHLALKDDPLLVTRSTGAGYLRTVEIAPNQEGREPPPRERGRGRGRGGRGRDQEQERGRGSVSQQQSQPSQPDQSEAPIGESGGFKHGQKRM